MADLIWYGSLEDRVRNELLEDEGTEVYELADRLGVARIRIKRALSRLRAKDAAYCEELEDHSWAWFLRV